MKPLALLLLVPALGLSQGSCSSSDRDAEKVVKKFIRAVESGRKTAIYDLLAPGIQKKLKDLAKLATDQTGGRRKFKPEEMLVVGLSPTSLRPGPVELLSSEADRARVKLHSSKRKKHEIIHLIKIEGKWRIILPDVMFSSPSKSPTRTQPASAPVDRG